MCGLFRVCSKLGYVFFFGLAQGFPTTTFQFLNIQILVSGERRPVGECYSQFRVIMPWNAIVSCQMLQLVHTGKVFANCKQIISNILFSSFFQWQTAISPPPVLAAVVPTNGNQVTSAGLTYRNWKCLPNTRQNLGHAQYSLTKTVQTWAVFRNPQTQMCKGCGATFARKALFWGRRCFALVFWNLLEPGFFPPSIWMHLVSVCQGYIIGCGCDGPFRTAHSHRSRLHMSLELYGVEPWAKQVLNHNGWANNTFLFG